MIWRRVSGILGAAGRGRGRRKEGRKERQGETRQGYNTVGGKGGWRKRKIRKKVKRNFKGKEGGRRVEWGFACVCVCVCV